MIQVYHNKSFTEYSMNRLKIPVIVCLAAIVETDELEEAYALTNNIDSSWTQNKGVKCYTLKPRSTSVGDILLHDGKYHVVEMVGFREVTAEEMKNVIITVPRSTTAAAA